MIPLFRPSMGYVVSLALVFCFAVVLAFFSVFRCFSGGCGLPYFLSGADGFSGCDVLEERRIVNGVSMEPLIHSGQEVSVLFGYYGCYPFQRGDVVLYNYSGNMNPVIKVVRGVPGDSFSLEPGSGGFRVVVNGVTVVNSAGREFVVSGRAYELLSLYVRDYKGMIPEDAYLLLGESPSGSVDSTRFGLVDRSDILGKVVLCK